MTDPKVRFKQYDGCSYPTVQFLPLSEYLEVNSDRNKNHNYDKKNVLSVSGDYGVVNQIEFQGRSFAGADVGDYHILYTGDIVYTKSPLKENPYGIVKYNKGPTGIVSTLYAVYHCKKTVDGRFIEYYFDLKSRLNNYLKPLVNIGAKHDMKISAEKAISGLVAFPCLEEQQKIADFLSSVDDVIAASEQEVANLETQKKAVMKKIFSQEVRFKREDGSDFPKWEACYRLEEVSDFITKGATPTTYGFSWTIAGIPFFRNDAIRDNRFVYGDFSYISEKAHTTLSRSEIKGGDILIAITGEIGKIGMVPKEIEKGNINQHIARVRIIREYIPYFVYQYLCSDKIQSGYKKIKTGLSMAQLSLEQIRNTEIPIVDLAEQHIIADFLSNFDEAISAAKKELELWKELKKGLLQQMFI